MKIINTLSSSFTVILLFWITGSNSSWFSGAIGGALTAVTGVTALTGLTNTNKKPLTSNVNDLTISSNGLNFIKKEEGLRLKAYRDSVGKLTIGYGHTKGVTPGMVITESKAESLLRSDVKYFEEKVKQLVKVPLNQNQYDALVSFTFNLGEGNLKSSTLLRELNQRHYVTAANEFPKWRMGGPPGKKRVIRGLEARRKREKQLFES